MYRMGIVTTVYYRNSLTIDLSNAPKTITKQHENFGRTLLGCPRSRMIKGIFKRTREGTRTLCEEEEEGRKREEDRIGKDSVEVEAAGARGKLAVSSPREINEVYI